MTWRTLTEDELESERQLALARQKLKGIRKAIRQVIAYPPKGHRRRTKDGYPAELVYDEWAYLRMIDSVRTGLKAILKEFS